MEPVGVIKQRTENNSGGRICMKTSSIPTRKRINVEKVNGLIQKVSLRVERGGGKKTKKQRSISKYEAKVNR